ncbi:protein sorting-associated protein 51 homolog [Seminavis robusta]|uniref:Vacuolar protein sorting-associated protein 51 homolog n=1 Tax=Seminavis robusta TaxID=568900 RepID=A0A9N8HQN8_9STRA|nr:protein sorting-associated protein 51 homolog [Seminavis robusta]|eukprot:Sro1183_g250040.1 protein sorting-associated protein 51 homolog (1001) ;mRNA; f:21439-24441
MDDGSSSDSDDEFLTVGNKNSGNVDREALVRKKLLESFYGQSADSDSAGQRSRTSLADTKKLGQVQGSRGLGHASVNNSADTKDLDSPYFDVESHTSSHIIGSSVHELLELDEQLTLQVRTLDSTTQNMVYENYSKFIIATDAVKSVGVSVQANKEGLERLSKGMDMISSTSQAVEEDLGSLRDAVAEKIRVKRLLTRLDALLKLPETLREQIKDGRFREAARSFCRSTNILRMHSEGFESLQKIETECSAILFEMVKNMKRKLRHWSGQDHSIAMLESTSEDNDDNLESQNSESFDSLDSEGFQEPPKSIQEIFECSGTLALLMKEKGRSDVDPGLTSSECQEMSITASSRFLERLLDLHQLEIQEAAMNASALPRSVDDSPGDFESDLRPTVHPIPTLVLDGILQTAALFRMSFRDDTREQGHTGEPDRLGEFVDEAYTSFLSHVKSILLEHSLGVQQSSLESREGDQEGESGETYGDIAGAMSTLLLAVRELASALSLPEVGVSSDIAAGLVEQAQDLAGSVTNARVDRMFHELQLRVLKDCLAPFVERITGAGEDQKAQICAIAVSDSMQLLDDTVRSVFSGREDLGASVDLPALKQSIQASTSRFASWLAGSFEVLAGCDSSDWYFSFEACATSLAPDEGNMAERSGGDLSARLNAVGKEDVTELSTQYDALASKVDAALQDLVADLDAKSPYLNHFELALLLWEMCRNCERVFVDTIKLSMDTNVGGGKKGRASGLFPIDDHKKNVVLTQHERAASDRFRLAGSRILVLYCSNQGFDAAQQVCLALRANTSADPEPFPDRPNAGVCRALEIAKKTSIECSNLFGETQRAGPLPDFTNVTPVSQPLLGRNTSPIKGLQLDVERMFQEKIEVYPHPSEELDSSRDSVLALFFRVMIKAIAEETRHYSFTPGAYIGLLVDLEFLRDMIPHYLSESFDVQGSNACGSLYSLLTDTLNSARDRCDDEDAIGNDDIIRLARTALRDFMKLDSSHSFIVVP